MKPLFPLLRSRRLSRTCLLATLAVVSLGQEAQAQCSSAFFANWHVCGSGTTIIEGKQASISLWIRRSIGVPNQAASFSITVSSSIVGGDPLNSSTVTIGATDSTSTRATFNVFATDTKLYEGTRAYSISARRIDPDPPEASSTIATIAGTIRDDESPPSFKLTARPTSWSEGDGSVKVSLTATLGEAIGKNLSVTFSASGTSDYKVSSAQTRTISQGDTSAKADLTFTPVNDDVDEPNASITVRARSNDSGIGSAFATLTQRDNDTSEALSFSRTKVAVDEGGTATYSVSLAEAATGEVTVSIAKAAGGDPDITVSPASLTFTTSNWSEGQTVTLKAAQDDDLADGTATINHTASGANYSGIRGAVTVTEEDDDTGSLAFSPSAVDVPEGGKATYSVSLSHEPSGSVTVSIAPTRGSDADITASPKSLTFTTSNWSTGQAVTVSAASDTDGLNGTATLRHTASGAEYAGVTGDLIATEQDKDRKLIITGSPVRVTEGSTAAYTLKLATRPTGTVTVSVSWLQGDSDLSATPASLSFTTLNWNTAKTVTVSAAEDDDLADGSATFTHTAKDGGYGGVMATATATEDDDDSAELLFSKRSVKVPEGGRATYTLRPRYAPTGTVTVGVAVADAGDVDITVSPSTLAFTTKNWSTAQTVTVSAREDDDGVDGSRQINHSATGAEYTNVSGAVTATEEDDDTAAIVLSKTSLTVAEAGTATYTVELATQPTAAVTVAIVRSTGDTSITFTPDTMTFTRSNWDDAQEVRVSAAEDDDGVNGEATLSHTASGGDYATLSKDASVTESDNDAQGLTLSERALTVREGGSDTYTVRLATQPSGNVTVRIARAAAGDTSITASPPSLSFTTITWSTPQTVTVSAAEDDDLADGSATFTHTAQGGGYGSVTGAVKATERDNDSAGLVFSRSALSVAEGGSRAYTVRLLSQPSARVTVSIAKAADGDPDLSASTDSLTFTTSNWNTAKTVTVTAGEDDDLADGSATFTHTASGGDYAAVSRSLTATEEDDDTGELEFSTSKVTVPEGGSAAYTLRLKFQPTGTVAVLLSRASGDLDLTVSPPAIVFTPSNWNVPRTLTLRAAQDNDLADGSATFSHAATGGGYGGVSGTITATEDDDDRGRIAFSKASVTVPEGGTAAYTVTLRFQPTATVTVSLAATGDSDITVLPPSLSFTRVNWNSPQTVTVSAEEDDDLVNGGASITHTAAGGGYGGLKPAVGAVEKDNDAGAFRFSPASVVVPEGGMAAYTVALAYRPGGSVTVALAATGDPDLTPSPASLTFTTTDWSTPQTVTVSARADDDIAPGRAAIQHTASGGGYGGLIESVTATEKDNDTPALTFSPPSVTVPEGGRATYTVTLSHQPVSSVAVAVGRSSGDADLAPSPAILTFSPANWDRPQSVRVSAEEDDDLADGSATIGHSALGGGYGAVTGEVMAREKDNDTARLIFSTRSFFVPEGRPATYSVRLSHEPSAAVTVAVARSSGDTDLTVMPPSLTFTTTNWETPQEVTVSAKEDEDTANGEAVFLHTASGGGYAGVMGEVTATESDNDAPGLTLSDTSPSVREGRTLAYTVSLAAEPTATVTVAVARSSGDTDLTVMPPSLTFTTTNWNGAQTLTVSAAEDDDLADGTATIRHTASGGGYDAVALDITATEIDNDTAGLVITGVPLTVEEGESATWTLRLATRPSATVTVAISRSSGDEDLSVTPPSLTFTTTNWNQTQEVTVSAGEDDDTANGEATFLHTASGGDYAGVTAEATAREMDNDTAGLMLSEDSLEVDGVGGFATVLVNLQGV
ncbi:MAG: hypothetical protein OXG96_14930 [Acidobacteria bacterium]|nr:hypothetical protein [Acidobacteriota bacterium]